MSEILNLAKGFEEKSKQQAQDTEQSVKREFERLERLSARTEIKLAEHQQRYPRAERQADGHVRSPSSAQWLDIPVRRAADRIWAG
jgi:hypothetical protein